MDILALLLTLLLLIIATALLHLGFVYHKTFAKKNSNRLLNLEAAAFVSNFVLILLLVVTFFVSISILIT